MCYQYKIFNFATSIWLSVLNIFIFHLFYETWDIWKILLALAHLLAKFHLFSFLLSQQRHIFSLFFFNPLTWFIILNIIFWQILTSSRIFILMYNIFLEVLYVCFLFWRYFEWVNYLILLTVCLFDRSSLILTFYVLKNMTEGSEEIS